jgi:hypothetical protein
VVYPAIFSKIHYEDVWLSEWLPYENIWLCGFFIAMFLIGKNIVYAGSQVICYFIKDKNYTYNGRKLSWNLIVFMVIFCEIAVSMVLCINISGYTNFQIFDCYLWGIPLILTNLMTIFIVFWKTDYQRLFDELLLVVKERTLSCNLRLTKFLYPVVL